MSKTTITKCSCSNEYQDKKYGKGNRVMNLGAGASPKKKCTVCGKQP